MSCPIKSSVFTGAQSKGKLPPSTPPCGRSWDPDHEGGKSCLLTNHLQFGATTISAIYKDRWQIELFFKAHQTKPENQNLCRNQRECPLHPDLDSIDRHAAGQVSSIQIPFRLVLVQPGGLPALESLYLQEPMGLDRSSFRCFAHGPGVCPVSFTLTRFGTASMKMETWLSIRQHVFRKFNKLTGQIRPNSTVLGQ